jgi:hypothetical protein
MVQPMNKAAVTAKARELDSYLVPVVRQRIATMGEDASGTYRFYAARAELGTVFAEYDILMTTLLLEREQQFAAFHEVGTGIGQLPFLMAACGLTVVGIESDVRRAACAHVLHDVVRAADPASAGRCRIVNGAFPVAGLSPDGAMAFSTNLVIGGTSDIHHTIMAGLKRYSAVIFDVDRMFLKRMTDADRAQVFQMFAEAGFDLPVPYLDLGNNGRYYRLLTNPS